MTEYEQGLQGVNIESFSKENPPTPTQVVQTATLYAQVFAGYPWFEVNRCPNCESYYDQGSSAGDSCTKCDGGIIGPAYPLDKTVTDIVEALDKPGASMFLAEFSGQIVGFAWTNLRDTDEYLKRFRSMSPEIGQEVASVLSRDHDLYSLAEIGVAQDMRGRGIGKELFIRQVASGLKYNLIQTAWTRHDTIIAPICLKSGFRQVFGPELVLENGRATLTKKDIIGRSPTDPDRVLFIKT
jgi:ribosomal protein S18 acetylase RimI-like enzyme